jgi:lipopolysaccharide/colanic/teichoic acid biosynthesis glycosyltransferase
MSNRQLLLATTRTNAKQELPTDAALVIQRQPIVGLLVKRSIDIAIALIAVVLLAPLLVVITIAIMATSSGPAIYRQERVGRHGKPFTILKFRSMHNGVAADVGRQAIEDELNGNASPVDGCYKPRGGPHVTRVGAILRRTSLDELPQLLNVVKGEMSLVGPRPCLPWEAELFGPSFSGRFRVKPGMTGLWQVSGRSRLNTRQMLHLDLEYVEKFSVAGDLRILLQTVPVVLRSDGAR